MNRTLALALWLTACANLTTVSAPGALEVTTVRRSYNNAHAVRTPEGLLLVDAGLERDASALADDLAAAGVDPAELALIVLTHGHADHAGGARWFAEAYGVPVLAGAGDADLLAEGHNDTLCPTDTMARRRLDEAQAETFAPLTPDHDIAAPFDLAELGLRGQVLPVGGHTEGSLVLDLGAAVFAGDLLRGSVVGRGATEHFFQCDRAAAAERVREVLGATGASTWFLGHFGPLAVEEVEGFAAGD